MVGAHVCANHTPALTFDYCAAKPNEKGEYRFQKNSDEFQKKSKPGGLNQAGQPEIFEQSPKQPPWSRTDEPEPVQKDHEGWPQV